MTKLTAQTIAGTPQDLSVFIGRNPSALLTVSGEDLSTLVGHDPNCVFHFGGGRIRRTVATPIDDYKFTCVTPHLPETREYT